MVGRLTRDNKPYRRGLVMGLTLAEIMVLVLFSLLLIIGFVTEHGQADKRIVDEVAEVLNQPRAALATNRFRDEFRVLVAQSAIGKAVIESLKPDPDLGGPKQTDADSQSNAAKKAIALVELGAQTAGMLGKNRVGVSPEKAASEFVSLAGQEYSTDVRASGIGSPRIWLNETLNRARTCPDESGGRGTEHPSCSVIDGEPEFVFHVFLGASTIRVHNNESVFVNGRRDELKLAAIRFDDDVPWQDFIRMTTPMFEWSTDRRCRFFVTVTDETPAAEKLIYKLQLRRVGQHFYYFEPLLGSVSAGR